MKSPAISRRRGSLPAHAVLSVWTVLVLFPLWTMIANSFKRKYDIYQDPFGPPVKWNFDSYLSVLRDGDFILFFRNSLVVTVGSIAAVLFFGALAAYALANWKAKPSRWIYVFFIAGMMLPIKIGSIRLLQLVKALGLIDTIWSLYPVYIAMGLPIAVFVLTEFIREIPYELTEAAVIDGAGRFKIFGSIIVHLLRPALATVAIFNLVPFWNDLWFPLIFINNDEHKTLLLGVTRLFGQYQTDWSKILAVLTLAAVPVIVLYLSMSKQFIKGLTAGAVKG